MTLPDQNSHVLLIETEAEPRVIELTAPIYSLGRHPSNSIVLQKQGISRYHAQLVRIQRPGSDQFQYKIVDGNQQGKRSLNGIQVNNVDCQEAVLNHMDSIRFGRSLLSHYYRPEDLSSFRQELSFSRNSVMHTVISEPTAKHTLVLPTPSHEEDICEPLVEIDAESDLWDLDDLCLDDDVLLTEFISLPIES